MFVRCGMIRGEERGRRRLFDIVEKKQLQAQMYDVYIYITGVCVSTYVASTLVGGMGLLLRHRLTSASIPHRWRRSRGNEEAHSKEAQEENRNQQAGMRGFRSETFISTETRAKVEGELPWLDAKAAAIPFDSSLTGA